MKKVKFINDITQHLHNDLIEIAQNKSEYDINISELSFDIGVKKNHIDKIISPTPHDITNQSAKLIGDQAMETEEPHRNVNNPINYQSDSTKLSQRVTSEKDAKPKKLHSGFPVKFAIQEADYSECPVKFANQETDSSELFFDCQNPVNNEIKDHCSFPVESTRLAKSYFDDNVQSQNINEKCSDKFILIEDQTVKLKKTIVENIPRPYGCYWCLSFK